MTRNTDESLTGSQRERRKYARRTRRKHADTHAHRKTYYQPARRQRFTRTEDLALESTRHTIFAYHLTLRNLSELSLKILTNRQPLNIIPHHLSETQINMHMLKCSHAYPQSDVCPPSWRRFLLVKIYQRLAPPGVSAIIFLLKSNGFCTCLFMMERCPSTNNASV